MKPHVKKLISIAPILITVLAAPLLLVKISYAVPAAPSPTCAIDATVLSVQKTKNIDELGQPPREDFYYYAVKLKIQSSSVYQEEGSMSCDNLINSEQHSILHLVEFDKVPIKAGQKINAKMHFGGDEWFGGYFLSDIKILAAAAEPPKPVKLTISGYVVSGGDTTPRGLFDAPRKFVYKIKTDDGSNLEVTYTAYPPSPMGDQERKKIRLSFHAGAVLTGDYLQARGSFDKSVSMLTIADEGDYIETSQKPQPPSQKPVAPPGNEKAVPAIKSSSEVSAILVEQKQLNAVDDIELSPDEQRYTVKGYRSAKLLFFIPVSVKVELKINAVNGNIEQVKKSWWAFFAR